MVDSSMIERWNLVDTADMAVRVKGILCRIMNQRHFPADFKETLQQGIEFLDEAKNGGSIILGELAETSAFEGTLSPLCWAADTYLEISQKSAENKEAYRELVKALEGYRKLLEELGSLTEQEHLEFNKQHVERVLCFFGSLADALIQEADPTVSEYSRPMD